MRGAAQHDVRGAESVGGDMALAFLAGGFDQRLSAGVRTNCQKMSRIAGW